MKIRIQNNFLQTMKKFSSFFLILKLFLISGKHDFYYGHNITEQSKSFFVEVSIYFGFYSK